MALYESAQYPFSIQYPASWAEAGSPEGLTAQFVGGLNTFSIVEQDISELGLGSLTLEEFASEAITALRVRLSDVQIRSREQAVSAQGLPVEIIVYTVFLDSFTASRLIYVHENAIAFTGTYVIVSFNYDRMEPLIARSFDSFSVVGR